MGFGPIVNQFSLQKTFGVKTDRKIFSKTVVQKVEEVFFLKVTDFICTWVLIRMYSVVSQFSSEINRQLALRKHIQI